jgi:hypothetical protein
VKAIGAMAVSTTAVDSCRGRGFRSELRAVIVVDGAYFRNRLGEASPRDAPRFWVFGIEKPHAKECAKFGGTTMIPHLPTRFPEP